MRFLLAIVLYTLIPAQDAASCPGEGSAWAPVRVDAGPGLGCAFAPSAPAWLLVTPMHRAVLPRPGLRQGRAIALPRVLLRYRCTEFAFAPWVLEEVRASGYVLDVAAEPCR
ncbi:MAG: hypothetical protein IT458_11005 [Planctomycetes bacterium]|nr:hypothetical protein [Planctomycetota bacterium]